MHCNLTFATKLNFRSYSPTSLFEFRKFAPQYFTKLECLTDNFVCGTALFGIERPMFGVESVNFDLLVTIRFIYPNCSSLSSSNQIYFNYPVTCESRIENFSG